MLKLTFFAFLIGIYCSLAVAQTASESEAKPIDLSEKINTLRLNPPKINGPKLVEKTESGLRVYAIFKDRTIIGWQIRDRKGKPLKLEEENAPVRNRKPAPSTKTPANTASPVRTIEPQPAQEQKATEKVICTAGRSACFVIEKKP